MTTDSCTRQPGQRHLGCTACWPALAVANRLPKIPAPKLPEIRRAEQRWSSWSSGDDARLFVDDRLLHTVFAGHTSWAPAMAQPGWSTGPGRPSEPASSRPGVGASQDCDRETVARSGGRPRSDPGRCAFPDNGASLGSTCYCRRRLREVERQSPTLRCVWTVVRG